MPLAVDTAGTLYAAVSGGLIYVSRDHAQTWAAVGSPVPPWTNRGAGVSVANIIPAGAGGALYAILNQVATSGFVTRLSADGSTILYSTYLRGHPSGGAFLEFLAEPTALFEQNWISGIALDPADNATVAGITRASDFPVAAPAQSANAGLADAFAATIAADGSKLTFSTYLGGSQDDGALAVGLDAKGSVILAGQTWSPDFPFSEQLQQNYGFGEAFLTKLAPPGPPSITAVLNGASFQPGIEAGSWVAIKGTNLANTSPGRIWRTDEVIGGRMPTSLDGVSVTIDGKPAFVYYISQSQINVQAPSDTALGPVDVVVNNNGSVSAPATAQLQSAAPAFFTYYGTDYAIASRLPDYAPVADPSVVPSTVAAHPGDTLTLWGTGFGPTNPPAPAGTAVTGNPVVVTMPQVSVGGVPVTVIGASLTPDSAGLYQVTVQLPSTVPTGAVAVEASAAGVTTQSSALLFIARP